ncbi:hypothetical protein CEXT_224921 [Caerostris extrusa]|uniref:eIF3a PCI domain-containing protein n=1 Tax=Caerostris extrusa TaxID=172846 RepID=A0AAV4XXY4_CAEEX|nr:hypothetical protein CEXT_224921 [Caerostris extrusa]
MSTVCHNPENALKRADALLELGKQDETIECLYDILKNRKQRLFKYTHETTINKLLEIRTTETLTRKKRTKKIERRNSWLEEQQERFKKKRKDKQLKSKDRDGSLKQFKVIWGKIYQLLQRSNIKTIRHLTEDITKLN